MSETKHYVHRISDEESIRIRRFLHQFAAGAVAFFVLIVLAIVFADRWILLISHASERRFIEPYVTWADEHLISDSAPELQSYVNEVATDIAVDMGVPDDMQLSFRVIKGDTLNAFTTVGGYIYIFEGLIQALDSENSLAMVLGHEIAHAKNRDPLLATSRGILLQLAISTMSGNGIDPSTVDTGSSLMLNTYSREQEEAADRLGLIALQQRYGHVGGATQLFDLLIDEEGFPNSEDDFDDALELLSTHPDLAERVDYLRSMAEASEWDEEATSAYPDYIADLLN